MVFVKYSLLTIGLVPIPLSAGLTATISSGLNSRKTFDYEEKIIPATADSKITDEFGETLVKGKAETKSISIKGEDNITLTLTQSNDSVANKLFTLLNSVLAVATGINAYVDVYAENKDLKSTFKKANDLLLQQLTICSYWDAGGDGSFFNYRLIDASFEKQLDEGITSISMTFSNYYNQSLTNDEQEKINNTIKG